MFGLIINKERHEVRAFEFSARSYERGEFTVSTEVGKEKGTERAVVRNEFKVKTVEEAIAAARELLDALEAGK